MVIDDKNYLLDIRYFIFRECTQNWKMEEHSISFLDITYITKGSARYTMNGINYNVQRGDLLCVPFNTVRAATTNPQDLMNCYAIDFHLLNLQGEVPTLPLPIVSHIGYRSDIASLFRKLSGVWIRKEAGYLMKSQALFMLILHRIFELTIYKNNLYAMDPRIQKTINYISNHYSEKLSVTQLAKLVKLKPVYFGALFKQVTGITVNQYLAQIRISQAENMLWNREYTIRETAELCGYNDIHHFRKQFKSISGYLPSQYHQISNNLPVK